MIQATSPTGHNSDFPMTRLNYAPAPNRRPRFPLEALRQLVYPYCAPPASPAAVGEARRWATTRA
jgi:hypothetical protein